VRTDAEHGVADEMVGVEREHRLVRLLTMITHF
jgi:hypothetical protein